MSNPFIVSDQGRIFWDLEWENIFRICPPDNALSRCQCIDSIGHNHILPIKFAESHYNHDIFNTMFKKFFFIKKRKRKKWKWVCFSFKLSFLAIWECKMKREFSIFNNFSISNLHVWNVRKNYYKYLRFNSDN